MRRLLILLLLLAGVSASLVLADAQFQTHLIDVGGYRLRFNVSHGGKQTILFEAGGMDDSSVWSEVAGAVGEKTGATIITYDRAALGHSDPAPDPYKIDNEVVALDTGLRSLNLERDLVIVAHSYGGFVATLFSVEHPEQVRGVVLIDANLAPFFTSEKLSKLMNGSTGKRDEMRKVSPAKAAILDAFPETVGRLRTVEFPKSIPCLVIAAERPPGETAEENAAWKRVHEDFVRLAPNRKALTAPGSGHFVMRDAPKLVSDAISDFATKVATPAP